MCISICINVQHKGTDVFDHTDTTVEINFMLDILFLKGLCSVLDIIAYDENRAMKHSLGGKAPLVSFTALN